MKKFFISSLIISLLGITSSAFAIELNSTNITQAPFNCATSSTECYLNNRNITSIASGTFINHGILTHLYLNNNQISSIEAGDFNGLSSLLSLQLDYNQISSINTDDFNGLSSLTHLNLGYNQITSIEVDDFNGLSSLLSLELRSNQITSIEADDFNGLSNLTTPAGNMISSGAVSINHTEATVLGDNTCTGGVSFGNIRTTINSPYLIMEKSPGSDKICQVTINEVGLKVDVPANQAPGSYNGTLTLTVPNF